MHREQTQKGGGEIVKWLTEVRRKRKKRKRFGFKKAHILNYNTPPSGT